MGGLPKINDPWIIPAGKVRCLKVEIRWTWPRWLRWLERRWRTRRGKWVVFYRFEVLP